MKYRKKTVIVEAVQVIFGETKVEEIVAFVGEGKLKDERTRFPKIITLEGEMLISDGDYIIKGVAGEFYPCKADIFEQTYEMANEKINFVGITSEETKIDYTGESFNDVKIGFVVQVSNERETREAIESFIDDVTEFVKRYKNGGTNETNKNTEAVGYYCFS